MLISTKVNWIFLFTVWLRQCHQIIFPRCWLQIFDSRRETALRGQRWWYSDFRHGRIFLPAHHKAVAFDDPLLHEVHPRGFSSSVEADPLDQLLPGSQQSFDDPSSVHEGESPWFTELSFAGKHDAVWTRASRHSAERVRWKSRQHDRHQEKSCETAWKQPVSLVAPAFADSYCFHLIQGVLDIR